MLLTLLKSTRPSWAAKNIHMYLLAVTYAYYSNLILPLKVLGGLIIVSMLWGALYTLNDLTDLKVDEKDRIKSKRPLIKEKINPKFVVLFVLFLIFLVFTVSFYTLPLSFSLILVLMVVNQLIYTLPPLRLKESVLAPLTSTATNNVLRVTSCTLLLGNLLIVPVSVYILVFFAGMGSYLMYKANKRWINIISIIFSLLLAYILLVGDMNLYQFLIVILPPFIATIPLYLSNYYKKVEMLELADFLYHKVVLVFYLFSLILFFIGGNYFF